MLRRQLLSKGIINAKEFDIVKNAISIKWEKENNFIERQNIELFKSKLELYETVKDYIGDIYSRKYVLKNVLKMSDEEIEQMKQEIQEEAQMSAPEVEPEGTDTEDTDVGSSEDGTEDTEDFGDNIGDNAEGADAKPTEEPESTEIPK
jgi:hypothetical protein